MAKLDQFPGCSSKEIVSEENTYVQLQHIQGTFTCSTSIHPHIAGPAFWLIEKCILFDNFNT